MTPQKHHFHSVFIAVCARLMRLLRKYPQQAPKICGYFSQRSFMNLALIVPGVDFTGLSVQRAEGTVVALLVCGNRNHASAISSEMIEPRANETVVAALVPIRSAVRRFYRKAHISLWHINLWNEDCP